MTIKEVKQAIEAFREKNIFDYEKQQDDFTEKLIHADPENFEIIKSERTGKLFVIPAANDFSLLFRGQTEEINPCLPTLHRKSPNPLQIFIERMRFVEFEKLLDSHPLVRFYKSKGFTLSYEGLAQHYGLKTEVMDFTSDIDIALFFAMCPYDSATDDYILPSESASHKGIIYVLNPYIYDFTLLSNNRAEIFNETVQPIGLQPFERPAMQKGYGILLPSGKRLNRVRVFDFEYTMEEAAEYHRKYTEESVLWTKDELITPIKQLSNKTIFTPAVFRETWQRFPVEGFTKSQCLKCLEKDYGIRIKQNAELIRFDADEIEEAKLKARWDSYNHRVGSRRLLSITDENTFRDYSPVMTAEVLGNVQMLRMAQSGMAFPENTRPPMTRLDEKA